ncbi:MAG: ABC transporter substrate-binding protein [Burkholderiales bacterium]|nr:ABC transporter substrate-binding protein [Burkholderiales bacterium]
MSNMTIGRRRFLQGAGFAMAAIGTGISPLILPKSAQAQTGGKLVYAGFGGSYEQAIRAAVLEPFATANNIALTTTTGGSDVAKITAMVKANRTEWDLVDTQGATLGQFISSGLLEELDAAVVNPSGLFDGAVVTKYSVPWYQFSLNIFWNSQAIKGTPASWADVWNVQKFPGKRGLSSLPWFSLEIALLADGVDIKKLYPLDVDRGFKSLDRIKPHAVFLGTSALANAISNQEVVIGIINLARLKAVQQAVPQMRYTWEQALIDIQQLVVLRGAPNKANAMKAIAYSLQPAAQERVLELLGYTPSRKSVLDKIDATRARDLPGTSATVGNSFYLNAEWWGKNGAAVGKRWQDWLAS